MNKQYCKCGCGQEIIFKSHHLLIEKRKLTIDELKNINFKYYVDKSGKRRYIRK